MTQRAQDWKLLLCITLMGLVAWSAYAASAEPEKETATGGVPVAEAHTN